jgi:hypothetical protein
MPQEISGNVNDNTGSVISVLDKDTKKNQYLILKDIQELNSNSKKI